MKVEDVVYSISPVTESLVNICVGAGSTVGIVVNVIVLALNPLVNIVAPLTVPPVNEPPPPPDELIVTAPIPVVGDIVTFVPAIICVTTLP